jgi:type IV pilus assembly protein PilW
MSGRFLIRSHDLHRAIPSARRPHGFTLIEMMVAMLLGLVVIGGVISVFLAGQQTYRTNEALGDVQNGSRTAFELLARDLRNAGLTGCDNSNGRLANVVQGGNWYSDWSNAVHGYDNTSSITDPALSSINSGDGIPVVGQSSVQIISTANTDITVSWTPAPDAANFKINTTTTQINKGDLIMVCDFDHAAIMQITGYNASNVTVEHNSGNPVSPGNCSKGLGYPTDCSNANGNAYSFPGNSRVAKLSAVDWYIGKNLAGTTSLYRLAVTNNSGSITPTPQEMVRNVTAMSIRYLQPPATSFTSATSVTNWAVVSAAQVTLSAQSTSLRASVNATPLSRTFTSTTTVRNRVL